MTTCLKGVHLKAGSQGIHYDNPVRVVAFKNFKSWSGDVSEDIAREIMRRLGLAGDELPSLVEAFVDRHLGPDRQLTLRLA
jgi:hypothetical protein